MSQLCFLVFGMVSAAFTESERVIACARAENYFRKRLSLKTKRWIQKRTCDWSVNGGSGYPVASELEGERLNFEVQRLPLLKATISRDRIVFHLQNLDNKNPKSGLLKKAFLFQDNWWKIEI